MEYSEVCVKCQERHLYGVKKSCFEVSCSGIPKQLWDEMHYPLEEMLTQDEYFSLNENELISLQYKYNKLLWAKDSINWSTFNEKRNFEQFYQKELLLCTAKRKVGRLGRRMGKCVSSKSLILTKEEGLILAENIISGKHNIATFDDTTKTFGWTKQWLKHENGIKPTFKLLTKLGNVDYVADNHPYYKLTKNGLEWVEVKDLKKGDKILAAKSYSSLYSNKSSKEENDYFKLLGYLTKSIIRKKENIFYSRNKEVCEELNSLLLKFDSKLNLRKDYRNCIYKSQKIKEIFENEEIKLNKIPKSIFSTSNENVAVFLSVIFENHCWVTNKEIGICFKSYEFANQIKNLLKRFGINCALQNRDRKSQENVLKIKSKEDFVLFDKHIKMFTKKEEINFLIEEKNKKNIPNNSLNIFPNVITKMIYNELVSTSLQNLQQLFPFDVKSGIRKDTIKKINYFLKDDFLNFLTDGNVIFDEIKSIEYEEDSLTYDLEVPVTHNFITNDLLTHNSEVLSVDALHFACNNPGKTVMILTPFQNTADELYERMCGMLEGEFSIYKNKFKKKAKPNTITIFVEGKKSVIKLFTTGTKSGSEGASTRGQKADRIYFDETAYFTNKDIETVYALALESEDVEIIAFSTPTALKTLYRQWCQTEPNWKDFHFPSTLLPNYESVKKEMGRTYDEQGFAQEILAEFFESSGKVFLTEAINAALRIYNYSDKIEEVLNSEQYICTIGVDGHTFQSTIN